MKKRRITKYVLLIIVALVIAWYPTGYYCMFPGSALNLSGVVNGGQYEAETSFHMVTVNVVKANLPVLIFGYLSPNARVSPAEDVIPSGWEEDEYNYYSKYQMQESHFNALKAAALMLGIPYEEEVGRVKVLRVVDDTGADGVLQLADVIIAINNKSVENVTDAISKLRMQKPNDQITMLIERDGQQQNVDIVLGQHPDDSERGYVGVTLINDERHVSLSGQNKIEIETGRIAGPSAGLMLTLEIVNKLTEEDITSGKNIAGTGTIEATGKVGVIGGINQKIIAAHRADIEVFFVPEGNMSQIKLSPEKYDGMKLVPVTTLNDALNYLAELNNDKRVAHVLTSAA